MLLATVSSKFKEEEKQLDVSADGQEMLMLHLLILGQQLLH